LLRSELDARFIPRTDDLMLWSTLSYYDKWSERVFIVPAGFCTDGASIPKSLWHIVGHPFQAQVREAAVVHDYLYSCLDELGLTRKEADQILYDICVELGMSEVKAQSFYLAVRAFGGAHV